MIGKNAVVTGATGGLGLATASGLAGLGARVGIVGRDQQRGRAAADLIRARHPAAVVDVFVADLSEQEQVRRLADDVLAAYPHLDVLVNNVGGFWAHRHTTVDGIERTLAVNHLAPFLLTNLLLPLMTAHAPARVVTVSSAAHKLGRLDFQDLQGAHDYSGPRAYNQSKLANLLFTYELATRSGPWVTANALHPGMVRTSFGADDQQALWKLAAPMIRPFMTTPTKAARLPVHLASDPSLHDTTGAYFVGERQRRSSESSYDEEAAATLWNVSARLVGLQR